METQIIQKLKYSKISYQKRIKLIKLVLKKRCSIKKAAETLQIKLSTAKQIVKKYKNKGKITKKRCQQQIQEANNFIQNEKNLEQHHLQKINQNQGSAYTNINFQEYWYNQMAQYQYQMQMNWFFNYYQAFNVITQI